MTYAAIELDKCRFLPVDNWIMAGVMRIMPSDPGFAEVNRVADWIAKLKNPQLFWDLKDMPEIERQVNIVDLEELFKELTH